MNIVQKTLELLGTNTLGRVTLAPIKRILPYTAVCLGLTLSAQASAATVSTLPQNAVLLSGQRLVDANCYNHLDMQSDGNLVIYAGIGSSASQALWSTGKWGVEGAPDGYALLGPYGNFSEYLYPPVSEFGGFTAESVWQSGSQSYDQVVLEMQTDGNLVLYPSNSIGSHAIWSTNTGRSEAQPPAPISCSMASSYTQLYTNEYLNGLTPSTSSTLLNGWSECGTMCVAEANCTGWTSVAHECTTYTGIPTDASTGTVVNPSLGVVSGVVVRPRLEVILR